MASTSGVVSDVTSCTASSTRLRATTPQTSVADPSPATADAATTMPRVCRVMASDTTAAHQSSGYQGGQPDGACQRYGPASAAIAPSTGATSGGTPRQRPSAARPAVAPA